MKMNIKHFDAINRHCPDAIAALRRYYNSDAKEVQVSVMHVDPDDLERTGKRLVKSMESMINKAEQEDRGLRDDEREAWDAIKDWVTRFEEVYSVEKPSNPLPKETREYELDTFGNPFKPKLHSRHTMNRDDPLGKEQRMEDWCKQFNASNEHTDMSVGDCVRAWLLGEHTEQTLRTMGTTGTGGVLIPSILSARIIDLARNRTRVIQAGAITLPMESKTLTVPRQVGDPSAGWRPELGHIKRTDFSFEPVVLKACSMGALVTLSYELLEDAVGLDAFLNRTLSAVLAEGIDQAALSGKGEEDPDTKDRIEPVGVLNTENVQEISMNAELTAYTPFSNAITKVRQVNGEPSGLMMAPVNFGILDALTATDGQPLMPPPSWTQVSHYDTNQLDEHTAIIGDWSQLAIGIRHNLRLEYATAGSIPKEGIHEELNLFSQAGIAIRVLWRGDVAVQRPDHFVKVTSINPEPEPDRVTKRSKQKVD